jgi:hypothetical protein
MCANGHDEHKGRPRQWSMRPRLLCKSICRNCCASLITLYRVGKLRWTPALSTGNSGQSSMCTQCHPNSCVGQQLADNHAPRPPWPSTPQSGSGRTAPGAYKRRRVPGDERTTLVVVKTGLRGDTPTMEPTCHRSLLPKSCKAVRLICVLCSWRGWRIVRVMITFSKRDRRSVAFKNFPCQ